MANSDDAIKNRGYLIAVDYRNISGKSIPLYHFVGLDGEYFSVLDWDFQPYFLVILDDGADHEAMKSRVRSLASRVGAGVVGFGVGTLKLLGNPTPVLATRCSNTGDVVALREEAAQLPGVKSVNEADILYKQRVIIDNNLSPGCLYEVEYSEKGSLFSLEEVDDDNLWEGRVLAWDIEAYNADGFPSPTEDEIIIISVATVTPDGERDSFNIAAENEKDIISQFVEAVKDFDPDVIVTYNGDGFDWPYLIERAKRNRVDLELSRSGRTPFVRETYHRYCGKTAEVSLDGRLVVDCYKMAKRDIVSITSKIGKLEVKGNYKLESVAEFLGVTNYSERENIPGGELAEVWDRDPERVLRYALDDAESTLGIFQEMFPQQLSLAGIVGMNPEDVCHEDRGMMAEAFYMKKAKEADEIIPNKKWDNDDSGDDEKYGGANVIEPETGFHNNVTYLDFACYDDQTEVLTSEGWRNIADVDVKEKVATLNLDNDNVEYQEVEATHHYEYAGKMHLWETPSRTQQMVTPNHRMVYKKRTNDRDSMVWRQKYEVEESQDVDDYWMSIPFFGNYQGDHLDTVTIGDFEFGANEFLFWFGIWLGDGTIANNNGSWSVSVSQREENAGIVDAAFDSLGLKYYHNVHEKNDGRQDEHVIAIHNKGFGEALLSLFEDLDGLPRSQNKTIPRRFLSSSKENLEHLLAGMMLSDGSANWDQYYTTSPQLADDVMEVCLKLGYHSRISSSPVRRGNRVEIFTVSVTPKNDNLITFSGQHHSKEEVGYAGQVHCLTVPNGTLVTRRDGKPAVSGNSLYPNIMIQHNISPDTVVIDGDGYDGSCWVAPSVGHRFKKEPKGFLPATLEELLEEKARLKKAKYEATGRKKTILEERYNALKRVINSSYGYLGWPRSRWYDVHCAESVTAYGRHYLLEVCNVAEDMKHRVVMGDTDGCGVKPTSSKSPEIEAIVERVNNEIPITIEVDERWDLLLCLDVKKRYCARKQDGTIMVKGLEVRRGDWSPYAQKAQAKIIETLLTTENLSLAIEEAKKMVEDLREGNYDLGDVVISENMNQGVEEYSSKQKTAEAARRAMEHFDNYQANAGDTIEYVVVDGRKLGNKKGGVTDRTITVDHYRGGDFTIDADYYIENQTVPAMMRLLRVLDVDENVVLGRPTQQTLQEAIGGDNFL